MLYLLERPDQKVELKTIDMVLFFRSVVWFSVCVWGAQTDPPLCGERMIEGGWRWKCSNTGWCTRCRHPPPCAHNHHYSTKPRPSPTLPLPLRSLFFPASPSLSLSRVAPLSLQGGTYKRYCITQDTEAGEGHSVRVRDGERGRERGSIVPCRYQLLIYKAGTLPVFFL